MERFDEIYNELFALSVMLVKQPFRSCFIEHYTNKILEFNKVLKNCTNENTVILNKIQLKLLEPILLQLDTSIKSDDKCLLLECLINILNITPIKDINVFFNIYLLLFSQIFEGEKSSSVISEELKLNTLHASSRLIENLDISVLDKLFKQDSGEKFSIGIFVSVKIARNERSIKLRLEALNFLLTASQFKENVVYNQGIYSSVADLFMLYLPGIISPLQEIIMRDETQHHLITITALKCWGHILSLVLCDLPSNEDLNENEQIQMWMSTCDKKLKETEIIDVKKCLLEKKRTSSWLAAVAITVKPLISKVTEVRKHSNDKCRIELLKVLVGFLENCPVNLESSINVIIDVLVGSLSDKNEEIQNIAYEALKKFEMKHMDKSSIKYSSVMETNFYLLVNKLPGIIKSGDEKLLLSSLKSFSGYLNILGKSGKLKNLLNLSSTLKKVLFPIQVAFELMLYPEISTEDFSINNNDMSLTTWSKQWKKFYHFTDSLIIFELEKICQLLGEHVEIEIIVDFLMDIFTKEHSFRKEILLILNQVILGLKEIKPHVMNELFEFYIDPEKLHLVLTVDNESCFNVKDLHSNIIKVALIMEGLRHLAIKLDNNFNKYLFKSLYYVVELMGNKYALIKLEATKTGTAISQVCGMKGSVEFLIKNNIDYLTYHSITKMKTNAVGVLDVLTVLIKNSGLDTMSNLEDIVNKVLKISCVNYNSPLTVSYLRVFHTFVHCLRNWLNVNYTKQEYKSKENLTKELVDFIINLEKKEEDISDEMEYDNNNESVEDEEINDELPEKNDKVELPKHIRITVAISNHCLNFLSSKDINIKLLVLEILNESICILSEIENELLPLIHKIWSPLVTKFDKLTEIILIRRSFSLLCNLARVSKYFLRSRALKNVLPFLKKFLLTEAAKSKTKDFHKEYFFTQNYKLQGELLDNLGELIINFELFEKQCHVIIDGIIPYLSSCQPKELQEKCKKSFLNLIYYDPYLIWFKLNHLIKNEEFSKNVNIILEKINENIN
ncbi:conserved hypothetical protein [Pediculus humanus corporis]|uniref:Uncharacterized protein n=1 Tax=Pediculus humanus subsp. corporis TaxID=121224 RepID=E0VQF0_PEDHC|nr:uncharacterized protein Phum_PHUM376830 [Pediculus humanus corporis]EEB15606.1 conserved hypothetical protein [Pediculus humanus corporis]